MQQSKKIKIQIKEKDKEALEFMQSKCRGLYNWWIAKLKGGESWRVYEAKKTLQASKAYDPEINQVYGKLLAEVYFRIDKAMKVFFRRCKKGEKKKGFPRFKPLSFASSFHEKKDLFFDLGRKIRFMLIFSITYWKIKI